MVGLARLFAEMAREEFRMHSDLFGGGRFAAFPVGVGLMAAGGVWLLTALTGTTVGRTVAGVHALVFAFGLHTGSIGLVGRDAMRDLLGDTTLLLYGARTLPLSRRRLLAVFVVKDLAYYSGLFLVPIALAFLTAGLGASVGLLWASLTLTFALGLAVTLTGIALSTRGKPGWLVLVVLAAAAGLGVAAGVDVAALTPYGLWAAPSLATFAVAVVPTPVLTSAGLALMDLSYDPETRTADAAFDRYDDRLPGDDPAFAKTLLDVRRSAGGFVKVPFSAGILFGATVALLAVAETLTGLAPSVGVSMGAMLGLTAFSTYNWVTSFDERSEYAAYPLSVADLFRAKFRAFLVLAVPTALAYFALAVVLLGGRPAEVAVGALLTVSLTLYLFGLVTYLAGFQPNEFLFDTLLFAGFGVAVAVVLVPVLVVGLTLAPLSPALLGGLAVWGLLAAGLGLVAYRRSVPRWTEHFRSGG